MVQFSQSILQRTMSRHAVQYNLPKATNCFAVFTTLGFCRLLRYTLTHMMYSSSLKFSKEVVYMNVVVSLLMIFQVVDLYGMYSDLVEEPYW